MIIIAQDVMRNISTR